MAQDMAQDRFQALPAELRNNIYELAFTSCSDQEILVELRNAKSPEKALLLTCRSIYNEARGIYRARYRQYWSSTHFEVDLSEGRLKEGEKKAISRLDAEDVEHISRLVLKHLRIVYTFGDGSWEYKSGNTTARYVAVGVFNRGDGDNAVVFELWHNRHLSRYYGKTYV